MEQEIIQTKTLPPAGELLKEAWAIWKTNFKKFASLAAVPLSIFILSSLFFPALADFLAPNESLAVSVSLVGVLLTLVAAFFQIVYVISVIFLVKERQNLIEVSDVLKRGFRKVASYIWVSFLVGLVVFGGVILFIIPGIIFSIWFSMAAYALIDQDLRGRKALRRSKELVKGNWWRVLWRLFVIGFLSGLVSFPFLLVASVGEKANLVYLEMSFGILVLAISVLVAGFSSSYGYLLYEKLRSVKESGIKF